jgi:DNA-directed RNA polymerase III subunit RPC6
MASSSAAAAGSHGDDLIQELKTKLYDLCALEDRSTVFRQDDLLALNVIPNNDIRLLLQVSQRLCDEKLFKLVRDGSAAGWMYRSEAEAAKSVSRGILHMNNLLIPVPQIPPPQS